MNGNLLISVQLRTWMPLQADRSADFAALFGRRLLSFVSVHLSPIARLELRQGCNQSLFRSIPFWLKTMSQFGIA
ncbi:MAG: hypothetical protein H7312_19315 [Tardiphaga sp.]|nr:hypothetical protein [Tardiphaga sp.]